MPVKSLLNPIKLGVLNLEKGSHNSGTCQNQTLSLRGRHVSTLPVYLNIAHSIRLFR